MSEIDFYTFSAKNGINQLDNHLIDVFNFKHEQGVLFGYTEFFGYKLKNSVCLDKKMIDNDKYNFCIFTRLLNPKFHSDIDEELYKNTKSFNFIGQFNFLNKTDLYFFQSIFDLCVFLKNIPKITFAFSD